MSYEEYRHLQRTIDTVLDDMIHRLRASAPLVSQSAGGSPKRSTAKASTVVNL